MRKKSHTAKSIIPIQHWKSKKGAHAYLVQRSEIPAITIDIFFKSGSSLDGKKQGLSSLTNSMLNQGTKLYDADEVADKFADVGAQFRMSSGLDSGCVGLKCLSEKKYFNLAFKLFLEILHSVNFPEHAFHRRQKQTLSMLQLHEQTPDSIAHDAFYHALYSKHPYAHSSDGTKKSVMSLTREDAAHFYKQYYVASNATIIMVGDMSRSEAEKRVEKIEESLAQGESAPVIECVVPFKESKQFHIEFPSEQTTIWAGHLGMNYNDSDYYAMRIGNDILGGSSITSRLFTQIRGKHGLVYGINSSFQFLNATGPFLIRFATKNSMVKKALSLMQSILHSYVSKGPLKKEFLLAKQKINTEFPLSLATNHEIIYYLVQIGFYKLPLDYIDTYQSKISAVSLNEVKAALKKHIQPDNMVKVIVGEY